ncbi:hypothetical protein KJ603_01705 [Patescibacteria group bacterium]|nr:hypothetical protein [Patescibacteria group bacterium]
MSSDKNKIAWQLKNWEEVDSPFFKMCRKAQKQLKKMKKQEERRRKQLQRMIDNNW